MKHQQPECETYNFFWQLRNSVSRIHPPKKPPCSKQNPPHIHTSSLKKTSTFPPQKQTGHPSQEQTTSAQHSLLRLAIRFFAAAEAALRRCGRGRGRRVEVEPGLQQCKSGDRQFAGGFCLAGNWPGSETSHILCEIRTERQMFTTESSSPQKGSGNF